jgi:hypothetical protein
MGPAIIVPLGAFIMVIVISIGIPMARAFARKMDAESRNPRLPAEVTDRMERMEQAIDSIALEVERISEGQRFTTKLLSEGKGAAESRQVSPGGVSARDRST